MIPACSTARTSSISPENPIRTWVSVRVHYCLGANLARLELRVLFEELLSRFGSVRVVEPAEWTRSNRHTGIRHLVVELRGG